MTTKPKIKSKTKTAAKTKKPATPKKKIVSKKSKTIKTPKPKLQLQQIIADTLDENKAADILTLDVRKLTDIADYMIICSGLSDRHLKSLADHIIDAARKHGYKPMGIEGDLAGLNNVPGFAPHNEWILVDFGDIIVHIMLPHAREFYGLEKLWGIELTKNNRRTSH
jgi:ribosome-associated protein